MAASFVSHLSLHAGSPPYCSRKYPHLSTRITPSLALSPKTRTIVSSLKSSPGNKRYDHLLRQSCSVKSTSTEAPPAFPDEEQKKNPMVTGLPFYTCFMLNPLVLSYNDSVYAYFPFPFFCSAVNFFVAVTCCQIDSICDFHKRAPINMDLLKFLAPIAFVHAIGHVMSNIFVVCGRRSFPLMIKAIEPFVTAAISQIGFGYQISLPQWLSLPPLVIGVLMTMPKPPYNLLEFTCGMISATTAFTYRNILSKEAMTYTDSTSVYAYISIIAFFLCLPSAILIDGPKLMQYGFSDAITKVGMEEFVMDLLLTGFFYHLYNNVAFKIIERVDPLTHSVGNILERVFMMFLCIVLFGTDGIVRVQGIGSTIAIYGALLYSTIKANLEEQKRIVVPKLIKDGNIRVGFVFDGSILSSIQQGALSFSFIFLIFSRT